jgi:glycosyltransferase involved in cell wall biosynthesis
MSERKRILWLVSWYPNKFDPFDGDFIQRHARAAALHHDIHVLFVKQSEEQGEVHTVWGGEGGLTEQLIYMPKKKGLVGKLTNHREWQAYYKAQVSRIIKREKPHVIHVHVPWKAGLIALWVKRKFNVPYLITEHWGIYNRVVEDNIHTRPFWVRFYLKTIFREAKAFASVSQFLAKGVNETLVRKDFVVIPNVVDTDLFTASRHKYDRFTFLHVSNMVPLKNVGGIVKAFAGFLTNTGAKAQLVFVGNRDSVPFNIQAAGLTPDSIVLRGEVPYEKVAEEMRRSHVFVLNSLIENSPCVIGEASCCGLPVIATAVGGVPELVNETNGILVGPNDTAQLTTAMISAWQNWQEWDPVKISSDAHQKYSEAAVGEAFTRLYVAD